ncbi:MAG: NUDIX hydrolase [Patescibacteria group bacterium]
MKPPWEKIKSRIVYKNRWITVFEDMVIRPDRKKGIYGYMDLVPPVGIVTLTQKHEVILEKQYRYPLKKYLIELPRGLSKKKETMLQAAKRELHEETGITASRWRSLGQGIASPGLLTEGIHLFLARELFYTSAHPDSDEKIEIMRIPFTRALRWTIDGTINDEMTIVALFRTKVLLKL